MLNKNCLIKPPLSRCLLMAFCFSGIFKSWAAGASTPRLCPKLFSAATIGSAAAGKFRQDIVESGFKKIGESNYFISGNVITESIADGTVRIYFERFFWPSDWMTRKNFDLFSAAKGVLAILPRQDGTPYIIDTKMADIPFNQEDLRGPDAKKPMTQQLVNAGFKLIPGSGGVYKYSSNKAQSIIAIVNGQKLVSLFQEMHENKAEKLPKNFRIAGVSEHIFDKENYREPYSELTITDGESNFVITSRGDFIQGEVIRRIIITPVTRGENQSSHWPQPVREQNSQFIIGGKNSNEAIDALKTINGIPISDLESTLRPHRSSDAGFLGRSESLKKVLLSDNNLVVNQLGLTHQELAEHMQTAQNIWIRAGMASEVVFTYEGRRYKVKGDKFRGIQGSPFEDNTSTSFDITITNLENNASMVFSGLVPELIWRYGFYEGKETRYRVEPKDILQVFDFLLPFR